MASLICNNCGRSLKLFERGYLFEDKAVCGRCIKILSPDAPRRRIDLVKVAKEARVRAVEQMAVDEDVRYKRAKRRVIFFLSGCISFFWLIIVVHLIIIAAMLVAIIGV